MKIRNLIAKHFYVEIKKLHNTFYCAVFHVGLDYKIPNEAVKDVTLGISINICLQREIYIKENANV